MPFQTCMGATLQCIPFGVAPSSLIVIPKGPPVSVKGMLAATIMDFVPITNIPPFGLCTSIANPAVASATAAALGVLTPMPCLPVPVGPWKPGAIKTKINKLPALPDFAVCNCMWGGVIKIMNPGQFQVSVL
ncbi:MAG: DUF4280 domain-containing protein [Coleofasciculus chthonoplastes F3-SA18-01]|uniref:DUF4280 domain-containing protein n=1 Tax=Coleofasciculus chthonoplastes TaxID=64178 RepID=UPI0032F63E64